MPILYPTRTLLTDSDKPGVRNHAMGPGFCSELVLVKWD